MGGKRVTQLGLTVHEVDAERNLLLVKGAVPGPKNGIVEMRAADGRAEGTAARRGGQEGEGRRARRGVFAAEVKPHLVHEAVRAELNAHRAGTVRDQEPRPRLGRPREAVAPEGHRPRRAGHDPRAAVHGRRCTPSRKAPRSFVQKVNRKARQGRAPVGAREPRRRPARSPSSTRRRSRRRRPSRPARSLEGWARARRSWSSSPPRRRRRRQVVPQPRARGRRRARPSSRSRAVVWARSLLVSEAALAARRGEGALVNAAPDRPRAGRLREELRRHRRRQLHVQRAPGRPQDADPPGGRGAVRASRSRASTSSRCSRSRSAAVDHAASRPGWKKAVVQLKHGETIEIFEGAQV